MGKWNILSYELSEDDIIALTYLIDIKVRRMTPRFETKTFTILNGIEYTFIFEENPYFTNTKFEIRLEWVTNEELIEIDDGYIEVISKSIDWKIDLIEINKNSFLIYGEIAIEEGEMISKELKRNGTIYEEYIQEIQELEQIMN
ncbi:hypothetical protein QTN25_010259 [Entamoeba marina]